MCRTVTNQTLPISRKCDDPVLSKLGIRMHTAFLLAAGFGTRLRPLTLARPKPLLPVCGIPMLDYALAHVRAHGHEKVLVNAHYLWEQVAVWADRNQVALQVELPIVLGTGGGLRAAHDQLGDAVVIVNADILSDVDLTALMMALPEGGASMALRADADAEKIGPVQADSDGKVVRITSVVPSEKGIAGTHFTGVHAMSRVAVASIPEVGEQCVIRTAYKTLVPSGLVGQIVHDGSWVDVGKPDAYLAANMAVLDGKVSIPIDPWTRGSRGPHGSWVGEGATIDGEVNHCVIGTNAVIPAGTSLRDCVVWDGVSVPKGKYVSAIFYDGGEVLQLG
jgi:mannose-1-phosphate guanylyltransferase